MKKYFYSLMMMSSVTSIFAQQAVSFESSEGYTLASAIGQNGWTALNGLSAAAATITNNDASNGIHSLLINNSGITGAKGLYKNLGTFPTNYEISFDLKNGGGAEIQLAGQPTNQMAVHWGVLITATGQVKYINDAGAVIATTHTIPTNTWTNIKIKVDNTGGSLVYYINNTQVATTPTLTSTAAALFAFTIEGGTNGMLLDNIKVVDPLLSVAETDAKSEVKIYPNPTTDFINISTPNKIVSTELFAATGQLVKSDKNSSKMDVRSLRTGVYTLKVNTDKGATTHTINIK